MRRSMICGLVLVATLLGGAGCGGGDLADQLLGAAEEPAGSVHSAGVPGASGPSLPPAAREASSKSLSLLRPRPATPKSAKRGVAFDLADPADFRALSSGVSWWYNWSPQPSKAAPAHAPARYQMDFYPMIGGISYDVGAVEEYLLAHPRIKYLLVLNEPNLTSQADLTPQQAASLWPDFEAIAAKTGVKLVGPALTWGTMPGYKDPVAWLDAFYAAYRAANDNRSPRIDYIAFDWYGYSLARQLDRLEKYGKSFWVTAFASARSQAGTLAKEEARMAEMVATCESRADVFRYAWFTGRAHDDAQHGSLLAAPGELTRLGQLYLKLPYTRH